MGWGGRKTNNSPRIDYETLSNMKRTEWHLNYLNACMHKFIATYLFDGFTSARNYNKAILKILKRLTNLLKCPCAKSFFSCQDMVSKYGKIKKRVLLWKKKIRSLIIVTANHFQIKSRKRVSVLAYSLKTEI